MIRQRLMIIGASLILLQATPGAAQSTAAKQTQGPVTSRSAEPDARRLLELTGANVVGAQAIDQLFGALRSAASEVPEKVWQEVTEEFRQEFLKSGGFTELLVPIYIKYFTQDELKQLIAFYESPVGKKLTNAQPAIVKESFAAGQERGREVVKLLQEKFKNRGYVIPIS